MASMCDLKKSPEISYPTLWSYRVILNGDEKIIKKALKGLDVDISPSNKTANLNSYKVSLTVNSKQERDEIFQKLSKISKFVL